YRDLIENARDLIWTVDLAGSVTFLNSACQTITGYSKEELLGKSLTDLIAPEHREAARQAMTQKWDGRQPRQCEIQILPKDGSTVTLDLPSALPEHGGAPAGVLAIARDITARKQAQEAVRRSAEYFEYLFSNHPMPMWVFDAETLGFLEVNQAAVEQYGYSR